MKRFSTLIILAALFTQLSAQLRTYLTIEAGPQWSFIKVTDPGNYFNPAHVNSSIAGLTLEQEVSENIFVATGLYYQPAKTGINMDDNRSQTSRLASHKALMIPLRFKYRIQPTEYPVSFTPRAGYMFSLNAVPGTLFDNNSILNAPDGTAFSYDQLRSTDDPGSHLLEIGIGVDLRFAGLWQASLNLSYLSGVLNAQSTSFTLDYTDQQGTSHSADYTNKGNGLYSTLSFHVPVSNIWQNRDYRIRARIENSVSDGKPVERKGQFYLGGEIGSLWRLFNTTNPAINARPMEGRGLFRYANLHTGGYVGYMITGDVGLDLGVYYQRSSTFYALMYDHQVDFSQEIAAPMYLEIPFRIRYYYDLYKEQIYVGVNGGISALTQFSSGGYTTPSGEFFYTDPATQAEAGATTNSSADRLSMIRPLLRVGAGAEYKLPMEFPLFVTLYVNYMQGFFAAEDISITNTFNENPQTSTLSYTGSGWSVDAGVKVPFTFNDHDNCVRLTKRSQKEKKKEERKGRIKR